VDERDEEGDVYGTYYLRDGATRLPHDGVTRCDACGSDVKDWYGAAAPGE
jgi:predicted HNH restriction endonuclease